MKLTVKDRIIIPELLPTQGGMVDMILVKSISDKVAITAKDVTDLDITQDGTTVTWNQSKDSGVEINFERSEIDLLKKQIKDLDDSKKITMRIFDLCMKIREM